MEHQRAKTMEMVSVGGGVVRAIYRWAMFWDKWDVMPLGVPSTEVSHRATKHDFVRRVLKEFRNYNSPGLMLGRMTKQQAESVLGVVLPYADRPDLFVAALNLYRDDCFAATNFRNSSDPVGAILELYLGDKDALEAVSKVPLDEVGSDDDGDQSLPDTAYRQGLSRVADITRMMGSDPTEPKTTQGVANHVTKANNHLLGKKPMRILRFLQNPSLEEDEAPEFLGDLRTIDRLTSAALKDYCNLLASTLAESFRGKWDIDNEDKQHERLATGLKRFGFRVGLLSKQGWNPVEAEVLVRALTVDAGDDLTAFEKLILVAQKAPGSSSYINDVTSVLLGQIEEECCKQTNFNSAWDFVDAQPNVKQYRERAFGTVRC